MNHIDKTIRPAARNLGTYSNALDDATLNNILAASGEMNFVDKVAYPHLATLEGEVVQFLLDKLHATSEASGFTTTGSSEAIILALAYHQRNFLDANPKSQGQTLNLVVSEAHHKTFEKYARLFGVELRLASLGGNLAVNVDSMRDLIDKNTFCLIGIAGSTELGKMDNIMAIDLLAQEYKLPVHVDAAIGGYVFPFLASQYQWDFLLTSVQSINISGHKYGLCLPGIGFLLIRKSSVMPKDYFENSEISYLSGGSTTDYALSCSRSAVFIVNAHHNLKLYGESGYTTIANQNQANARYFAQGLSEITGINDVIQGDAPVVNFASDDILELSTSLSSKGWIQSPHLINALGQRYIRIVIRKHITHKTLKTLLDEIRDFYHQKRIGKSNPA
jgi:glutamate decarboxylase